MYCCKKDYILRYTDVDLNDCVKLSSLLSLLEESACVSADELGFGYGVLQPRRIGFFLSNWYIELFRPVKLGEVLSVNTWPVRPGRIIALRDFELFVGKEKVGVATSRWCIVNLDNLSFLNSSCVFSPEIEYNECRSVDFKDWKIPVIGCDKPVYSKTASYSDYDHYNHVNNTRYGDFLMDAFSVEELTGKYFSSVQISYVKQTKFGDLLEFYRKDDGVYTIVNGCVGQDIHVQMRVTLKSI